MDDNYSWCVCWNEISGSLTLPQCQHCWVNKRTEKLGQSLLIWLYFWMIWTLFSPFWQLGKLTNCHLWVTSPMQCGCTQSWIQFPFLSLTLFQANCTFVCFFIFFLILRISFSFFWLQLVAPCSGEIRMCQLWLVVTWYEETFCLNTFLDSCSFVPGNIFPISLHL